MPSAIRSPVRFMSGPRTARLAEARVKFKRSSAAATLLGARRFVSAGLKFYRRNPVAAAVAAGENRSERAKEQDSPTPDPYRRLNRTFEHFQPRPHDHSITGLKLPGR